MKKYCLITGIVILMTALTTGCTTGNQTLLSTLNQEVTSSEETEETSTVAAEMKTGTDTGTDAGIKSEIETNVVAETKKKEENPASADKMMIHICGAVKAPGVFQMEAGSRVIDAVQKAGGFTENASQDFVNLAIQLEDGTKIVIPTIEEAKSLKQENSVTNAGIEGSKGQNQETDTGSAKVNINTATEETLCTLTGIGSSRAKTIIAYREQAGGFQKIEDIMNVDGIKEGSFQKIKDFITVD